MNGHSMSSVTDISEYPLFAYDEGQAEQAPVPEESHQEAQPVSVVKALRVTNREALQLPEVQDLFARAFKSDAFPEPEKVWEWCMEVVENPDAGIFVARDEDMNFVGILIGEHSSSVWSPMPMFLIAFYSENRSASESLLSRFRGWGLEFGQRRFRAILAGNRDSEYFETRFKHLGGITKREEVISCEFSEED